MLQSALNAGKFIFLFLLSFYIYVTDVSAQLRPLHKENDYRNGITKISFYSGSTGYVGFTDWIGFTTDSGKTFIRKSITLANVDFNGHSGTVTSGFRINGIKAFNKDTLIAYGYYDLIPSILYSVNGGDNFKLILHSRYDPNSLRTGITDMVFPENSNIGYAIDADRIFKTTDKGLTWKVVRTDPVAYFEHIEAINDNAVYVFGIGETSIVRRSFNGGSTWGAMNLPPGKINYLTFRTESKGWVSMYDNTKEIIYYTQNGGVRWKPMAEYRFNSFMFNKMKFLDDSTGLAIGKEFKTYKTTDSGKVWQRVSREVEFSYLGYSHVDIHIWDRNIFWVGGGHGYLEFTSNGGGELIPAALFDIDTTGLHQTGMVLARNRSKPIYGFKWFVNRQFMGESFDLTYKHDIYSPVDSIILVVSDGKRQDTTLKIQKFNALKYPSPKIFSFSPNQAKENDVVIIKGNYFRAVSAVRFGGIDATSYTVLSDTVIHAVVGKGGNGAVTVESKTGIGSLSGFYTNLPPVLFSVTPLSGPAGTVVTIQGANFSPDPEKNIVYFGSVRAKVISVSADKLQVVAPPGAGYLPVTVTVNYHTAYSQLPFSFTFDTDCDITGNHFKEVYVDGLANVDSYSAYDSEVADLDADGANDIVAVTYSGIAIHRNSNSKDVIRFESPIEKSLGGGLWAQRDLMIKDVDGDGLLDILVTGSGIPSPYILKNNSSIGKIKFDTIVNPITNGAVYELEMSDLDGDGKPELITANVLKSGTGHTISVFRNISNQGVIAFERKIDYPIGNVPVSLHSSDLDGDGKNDLVVLNSGNAGLHSFAIFKNISELGIIQFENPKLIKHTLASIYNGGLADMNGDGKLDVCLVYSNGSTTVANAAIVVLKNISQPGTIEFDAGTYLNPACGGSETFLFADLDGDAKCDFLFTCRSDPRKMYALKNTSTRDSISATYSEVLHLGPVLYTTAHAIADFDLDSKPDILSLIDKKIFRNMTGERGKWAGMDTVLCAGQNLKLGALPLDYYEYEWTSSAGDSIPAIANPYVQPALQTSYFVKVKTPNGCIMYDTIEVKIGGPIPQFDAGRDTSLCIGNTIQLGVNGDSTNSYTWISYPAGFYSEKLLNTVAPQKETSYILTVNNGQCVARDTIDVYVYYYPKGSAGPDKKICEGTYIPIGIPGPSSAFTTRWTSFPEGFNSPYLENSVNPKVTTTYYLHMSSGACSVRDTVTVFVSKKPFPPTITSDSPFEFCEGDSILLKASIDTGITRVLWYQNGVQLDSTRNELVVSSSGKFDAGVKRGECYAWSASVEVKVFPVGENLEIKASGPTTFCVGESVLLTSSSQVGNQWYLNGVAIDGATNRSFTATQGGDYSVTSRMLNCVSSSKNGVKVTVTPKPPTPVISRTGNTLVSSSPSGNQWYFNGSAIPGANQRVLTVEKQGNYTVKVVINGCGTDWSVPFNYTITSINSPELEKQLLVLPNPVKDKLTIKNTGSIGWFSVSIVDLSGRAIHQSRFTQSVQIDMSAFSKGYYILKVINESTGDQVHKKILKN